MWNIYPYKNLTDLNLDFILKAIGEMENQVKNFVALNAIKYADPIQWDITRSYEKNTVVIDGHSGVAYISVAPVPYGVALTRPEYWTVVFDLSSFITKGAANFANSYESQPTTTATMDTNEGEWVVWDSTLFEALTDIHAGDAYVENGNIKRKTVEDFYNVLFAALAQEIQDRQDADTQIRLDMSDLITSRVGVEAQTRADEDTRIEGIIGQLSNLQTTDKTSTVSAINEVNSNLAQEVTDRTNADNTIDTTIGSLANLNTSDKTSVVNAINSVFADMKFDPFTRTTRYFTEFNVTDTNNNQHDACADFDVTKLAPVNVLDYGIVADGVTDNTTALITLLSNHKAIYFPKQDLPYYFNGTVIIPIGSYVKGEDSDFKFGASASFYLRSNTTIDGFTIDCNNSTNAIIIDTNNGNVINTNVRNIIIKNPAIGIKDNGGTLGAGNGHIGYDIKMQDVKIYNPRGTGGVVTTNLFGFILLERVMIDFTSFPTTPTNYGFYMEGVEGATFIRCDVLGRGLTEPASANTSTAFYIKGSAIWFNKCMVDTVAGFGFNCTNSTYVYFTDCIASMMYNSGIYLENCNYVQIDRFYGYGRKGTAGGTNIGYNSAIILYNVTKATCTNINVTNFIDYGMKIENSNNCIVTAVSINNSDKGLYEVGTSDANIYGNILLYADHYLQVLGTYSVVNSVMYQSGTCTQYHQGALTV